MPAVSEHFERADSDELAQFGYKQELDRSLGSFSSFAAGFSYISILTGVFQLFGFAGPPSAKASEAYSKYIVVDMYAKAIQGMSAEEAAKWAEGELKRIYG